MLVAPYMRDKKKGCGAGPNLLNKRERLVDGHDEGQKKIRGDDLIGRLLQMSVGPVAILNFS